MRRIFFLIVSVALMPVLFSCGNLTVPESVSIKTNAKVQIPLGTASLNVGEYVGPDKIRTTVQDALKDSATGSNAAIYTYAKDENDPVLRYLVSYPAFDMPLDISSYLSGLSGLTNPFEGMETSYPLPKLDPITLDLGKSISMSDFADEMAGDGISVESNQSLSEGTANISSANLPSIHVEGNTEKVTFTRMYYESGVLRITFTKNDSFPYSSGYSLNVTASVYDSSNNLLAQSSETNIVSNPVIDIPLTSPNGLPQSFDVKFSENASGGQVGVVHQFTIKGETADIAVKKIVGLNVVDSSYMNKAEMDVAGDMDLSGFAGLFNSARIEDGLFHVEADTPGGWSGVSMTVEDYAITGECVSETAITDITSGSDAGKLVKKDYNVKATITPDKDDASKNTASFTAKVRVNVSNATIVCTDEIPVTAKFTLDKIKSASVNLKDKGFEGFSVSGEEGGVELPGELIKFVNWIDFTGEGNGFGIKAKVTNTLPAGNDIPISFQGFKKPDNSGYFYNVSDSIPAGSNATEKNWTGQFRLSFPEYVEGEKYYLDMSATIDGADDFTINNFVLGEEYTIGISDVELVLDWNKVSLDLSSTSYGDSIPVPDMSSMLNGLNDVLGDENDIRTTILPKIRLAEAPIYIYAMKPDEGPLASTFENLSINGTVFVSYKDADDNDKYVTMIGSGGSDSSAPTESATIRFTDPISLPENKDELLLGTNVDFSNASCDPLNVADILSLIDAKDAKVNFSIGLSGIDNSGVEISRDELPSEGDDALRLALDVVLVLPLDLRLLSPIEIDVMKIAFPDYDAVDENGMKSDLLTREDKSTYEEFASYVEGIDYVKIRYKVSNSLIPNLALKLKLEDEATGIGKDTPFEIKLRNSDKYEDIELTGDNIRRLLTEYPFHPETRIQLGRDLTSDEISSNKYAQEESLYISRSGLSDANPLGLGLVLEAKMDGDVKTQIWSANSEGGH